MKEYRTIKVRLSMYRLAKVLAAKNGEKLVNMLDRLVKEEAERQGYKGETDANDSR